MNDFYKTEEGEHVEPRQTIKENFFAAFVFLAVIISIASVILDAAGFLPF